AHRMLGDDPAEEERDATQRRDADRHPRQPIHLGVFHADRKNDDHVDKSVSEISRRCKVAAPANPHSNVAAARMYLKLAVASTLGTSGAAKVGGVRHGREWRTPPLGSARAAPRICRLGRLAGMPVSARGSERRPKPGESPARRHERARPRRVDPGAGAHTAPPSTAWPPPFPEGANGPEQSVLVVLFQAAL